MERVRASDEWLMGQVADGETEHLEMLMRRYANPLLTFIRRMIGDAGHSEEVFQDVFVAVWKNRRRYDEGRRFRPWLYAIAVNKVRQYLRLRPRRPVFSLDGDPPIERRASLLPVDTAVAVKTTQIVTAGIRELPLKQRAVVVMRIWAGLSYAEIAAALGRHENTVRSNMHHGLAALRAYLEPRLRERG